MQYNWKKISLLMVYQFLPLTQKWLTHCKEVFQICTAKVRLLQLVGRMVDLGLFSTKKRDKDSLVND